MPEESFDKILSLHPTERILMATDWPWRSVGDTIKWIKEKNMDERVKDAILGENARVLLGI